MTRWLEIGPGESRLPGEWITLDCTPRAEVVDYVGTWGEDRLPFGDNSFELVYASHVLEHVPWYHTVPALTEVHRILQPGGALEIHVPDLDVLIQAVQSQKCLDEHAEAGLNRELYWMHWVAERLFHIGPGPQWHRACFNADHMTTCLRRAGFSQIERLTTERGTSHGVVNLGMQCRK